MYCPICRYRESRVVDSRLATDGMTIRRRRECEKCTYRFSTIEEMELLDIVVVKSDGRRESYSRNKLKLGILQSLTKRPYTQEAFDSLIHAIERDLQKKKKREVTSKEVGEIVMKYLAKFDKIAYIRFASIYRAFTDVKKFRSEVQTLEEKRSKKEKMSEKNDKDPRSKLTGY